MPRPIIIALVASLCFAFPARAEDKPSPAAKRILDKAVAEVRKNRDEFAKANAKPLAEAKKALEDQAKKLIEEGKADEATAILGQVKTLEADVMKMANAPAPVAVGGGRFPPQKPLLERLAGEWDSRRGFSYRLYANGNAESVNKESKAVTNQGRIGLVSPEEAEVRWDTGERDRFIPAGDDSCVVLPRNPAGTRGPAFAIERMK